MRTHPYGAAEQLHSGSGLARYPGSNENSVLVISIDSPQAPLGRRESRAQPLVSLKIPAPLLEQEGWREAPGW
jgi:hypothetical protein